MWSPREKRDLLVALETHGPNQLDEIQKYFPEKSITEIRCTIEKYRLLGFNKAQNLSNITTEEIPLNQWIKLMKRFNVKSNGVNDLISRILKYIALFEEHTDEGGLNLRECYLALSELCKGEPIKILDSFTSHFLYGCLTHLSEALKKQKNKEMFDFVKNIKEFEEIVKSHLVKSYGKRKMESFEINPLKVPSKLLKLDLSDDDEDDDDGDEDKD